MIGPGDVLRQAKPEETWLITSQDARFFYLQQPGTIVVPVPRGYLEGAKLEKVSGSDREAFLRRMA